MSNTNRIEVVNTDLLDAFSNPGVDIVLHQVNCQGAMNSGVAGALRKAYPIHYIDYMYHWNVVQARIRELKDLLGHHVSTYNYHKVIIGVFGQERYGTDGKQYTSYLGLYQGVRGTLIDSPNSTIALPYGIGCGLGGADWSKVYFLLELLTEEFEDANFLLYKL